MIFTYRFMRNVSSQPGCNETLKLHSLARVQLGTSSKIVIRGEYLVVPLICNSSLCYLKHRSGIYKQMFKVFNRMSYRSWQLFICSSLLRTDSEVCALRRKFKHSASNWQPVRNEIEVLELPRWWPGWSFWLGQSFLGRTWGRGDLNPISFHDFKLRR